MEGFQERAHGLLKDRHHSVMLTGVTLMLEMCSIQPALIPFFREEVPLLVKILRTLLTSPFVPEYDAGGVTNPFLQVKVSISTVSSAKTQPPSVSLLLQE